MSKSISYLSSIELLNGLFERVRFILNHEKLLVTDNNMSESINYLSKNTRIHESVKLEAPVRTYGEVTLRKGVRVGKFTFINRGSCLFTNTEIGRYSSIGKRCEIGAFDHPIDWASTSPVFYNHLHFPDYGDNFDQFQKRSSKAGVIIGNDVWLGTGVLIRRGITIGDGAVIAANAVVTKDVPPYAIVGGLPAKLIRYRFSPDIIRKFLILKWWDMAPEDLKNIDFDDPEKMVDALAAKKGLQFGNSDEEVVLSLISERMTDLGVNAQIIDYLLENKMKLYLRYNMSDVYDQQILHNKIEHVCELENSDSSIEVIKKKILTTFFTKE